MYMTYTDITSIYKMYIACQLIVQAAQFEHSMICYFQFLLYPIVLYIHASFVPFGIFAFAFLPSKRTVPFMLNGGTWCLSQDPHFCLVHGWCSNRKTCRPKCGCPPQMRDKSKTLAIQGEVGVHHHLPSWLLCIWYHRRMLRNKAISNK